MTASALPHLGFGPLPVFDPGVSPIPAAHLSPLPCDPRPLPAPARADWRRSAEGSTFHANPRAFINKQREAILIRVLDDRIAPRLLDMYLAFRPRPCFQGLPPIKDQVCKHWVEDMTANGVNLVAMSFEQGVVGHTAIFPMDEARCEMLVVVSPTHQNTGIGTELVRCSIQLAYEIGFEKVWLPVESTNVRARHIYKKCGFDYLPGKQARELEMALDLKRYRDAVGATVAEIIERDVATAGLDDTCRDALQRMLKAQVASLPVVDEAGELQGVLCESDLLTPSNLDKQVRDIFTRQALSVCLTCTIAKLVRLFQSSRIRSVPVIDSAKRLVGIVGRRDILAYYAKHVR